MPNFRFVDPDQGLEWDSEYEWHVYRALRILGAPVRRSAPGTSDTFDYSESKHKNVQCMDCGSTRCVQKRTYTPDLYVAGRGSPAGDLPADDTGGYWLEAKGYFRADKRKLFRAFRASNPEVPVRLLVYSNKQKVGKGTLVSWAQRYAKVPVAAWDPRKDDISDVIPAEWMTW